MMSKDKDKDKDKQQKENKIERGLRPKVFTDVIGREKEKESLRIMIKAAQERGEALDHILFHGPPGLGKTTLAHVVAKEMGADIMVTSGPAIERQGDLASIITNISENGILFIDEIHRLNKVVEEIMYPAMEDNVLDIIIGKGPSAKTIRLDLPRFTVIGATTRIGLISSPLRNRFGASYRLDYYNTEELVGIVEQKASMLEMEITENGALEIARRSRGTPRIAVRLVKRVRDYAQVNTRSEIDESVASKALEMQKIDEKGLDYVDRKILSTIVEKFQGGPVGLTTISAAISEELDTLSDVYEPFLIQAGMLKKTPRGRVVTKEGYMHLGVEYEKHQDKLL